MTAPRMVADKSDAAVIPVRIDGVEHGPFTHLRGQARRHFRPKVTVTVLEPVKLSVAPELRGKHRRRAAGAALYEIMSDLVFRTTSTDRTIVEAVIASARRHGFDRVAIEDPVSGHADLRAPPRRRRGARAEADAARRRRRSGRRHAAQFERRRRHHPRPDVGGPRPGDDQLHRRQGQHPRRLPRGRR